MRGFFYWLKKGHLMGYQLITEHVAPYTHPRPAGHRYHGIAIHHWGDPADKPTFEGTVAWLTRKEATASVPYVAESGRVARIADPAKRLCWHAGDGADGEGNNYWLAIEVNPRWSDGDYQTVAELIRDIRTIEGDLPLAPHSQFTATECPGAADLERLDRLARATSGGTGMFKRHPVDNPRITYGFGAGGDKWGANKHLGVDYGGYEGQPIYAPADGTVVRATDQASPLGNPWEQIPGSANNGKHIIIKHDAPNWATHTLYAHLSAYVVREGQHVTAGQLIGHMGNTGYSFGTHLHWEMFIDYSEGQYPAGTFYGRVNPFEYFDVATRIPVAPGSAGGSSTNKNQEWYLMPDIPTSNLLQIEQALMSRDFGAWLQQQVVKAPIKSTDGKVWPLHSHVYGITQRQQQLAGQLAGQSEAIRQLAAAQGATLDYAKITDAAKAGALEALKETNQVNAEAIADAVVDEQAERLNQKETP